MRRIVLLVLCVATTAGAHANAQDDEAAHAQRLFEGAQAHIDSGEHVLAIVLLEQSMELFPHAPTAYSLAISRIRMGQAIAAEALLTRLLSGEFGELPAAQREDVEARLAEAQSLAASLALTVLGVETATLRVDEEDWGTARRAEVLTRRVDAGDHEVRAMSEGRPDARARATLQPGETVNLTLEFEPEVGTSPEEPSPVIPIDPDEPAAGMSRGGKAVLVGGALALAIGGILTAILLTRDSGGTDPHPVFGRPEALVSF